MPLKKHLLRNSTTPPIHYKIFWTTLLYHNNLTLCFHHLRSTYFCFLRVFIWNCYLQLRFFGYYWYHCCTVCGSQIVGLENDGRCSMQFLLKLWKMVIFNFVFVNLFFSNSSWLVLNLYI